MPSPLDHADDFVLLNRSVVSDGMGGTVTRWIDGAPFKCLLTLDSSMEARTAEQAGVTSLFSGLVDKAFPLDFHDAFKRASDGTTFRVTNDPKDDPSPPIASFAVKAFSAEKWVLPI